MIAVVSLIIVLVLSLIVVRIATVALALTGLSKDAARFQARSAFTGAGFTTNESERVVAHPVRRRVIMLLMLLGNAGIVTAVSSLILSFTGERDEQAGIFGTVWFRLGLIVVGLMGLLLLSQSRLVDRWMSRVITWALERWTDLDTRDYASLLHLTGGWGVTELMVEEGDWIAERRLQELRLNHEGIIVLGIDRADGQYVGAPRGKTVVRAGDRLLLYGRQKVLHELDERKAGPTGSRRHVESVAEQAQIQAKEDDEDDHEDSNRRETADRR